MARTFLMLSLSLLASIYPFAVPDVPGYSDPDSSRRHGRVRVVGHSLVDAGGPFLGLGASYFTALWRCRNDRARLKSDLAFLSRSGFNYVRMLSMVGWNPSWSGLEIAPVSFVSKAGKQVEAWQDYWLQLRELIDLAYDKYGLRTQITLFADSQLMPSKPARIEHMRRLLAEAVPGREHKILMIEVANEAWQNGFPGEEGVADLREFTKYLADGTQVPIAITSNHAGSFSDLYKGSAADVATWHFSRDKSAEEGWKPVTDCWDYGYLPGLPPVSSNEPIGPGSSVAAEKDVVKLVMAAAFAYTAKLPAYVFHSSAGVQGKARFEEMAGIESVGRVLSFLPRDLANWRRNDGKEPSAVFTAYAAGKANRYWSEVDSSTDGCLRNVGSRKGDRFVCVPIGIRPGGLQLQARESVRYKAYDPLTGEVVRSGTVRKSEMVTLPQGAGAYIVVGRVVRHYHLDREPPFWEPSQ